LKKVILIISALFFLSCKKGKTQLEKLELKHDKKVSYNLSEIPKDWTLLSIKKNKTVVFNPCDAENYHFEFKNKGPHWELIESAGHETMFYKIISAELIDKNLVLTTIIEDPNFYYIFTLKNYSSSHETINWIWNYEDYSFDYKFTNENGISNYEIINQPCRECWEEEICNEKEQTLIDSTYPKWLTNLYPTISKDSTGYHMDQELVNFRQINDSVTYSVLKKTDGICLSETLSTQLNNVEFNSLEITNDCDHELSMPSHNWKNYKFIDTNIIEVSEFTEAVHDSLINEFGLVKEQYDFLEADTKIDSTLTIYKINSNGEILKY